MPSACMGRKAQIKRCRVQVLAHVMLALQNRERDGRAAAQQRGLRKQPSIYQIVFFFYVAELKKRQTCLQEPLKLGH